MSVISLTDFQADETCSELHTHDGYSDCYTEDDEWDEMLSRAFDSDYDFDHAMGMMLADY